MKHKIFVFFITLLLLFPVFTILPNEPVQALSYNGLDLATAILANVSTLISSSYFDTDTVSHRQGKVLSALGNLLPTDGPTFAVLSTGLAGIVPATSQGLNPGNERGNWYQGGQYGLPRDESRLTLTLRVPLYMHYLYYDVQFFTAEWPEYVNTQYNDKFTMTVNSPSKGITSYTIDVNGGDFVLSARDAPLLGTGYNVYATDGNPGTAQNGIDWLTTTPNPAGADAGATALVGREHPVSPGEQITVTFDIIDTGDNQVDSMAFIDNLRFSGYAKTEVIARKSVVDLNGGYAEPNDLLEYMITISNIGTAAQNNNPGNEFEDLIPANTQYVPGSATASAGTISYDSPNNKIIWDGSIPSQSSIALSFRVKINSGVPNAVKISNQGTVNWDSNEDGINDKIELTDDPTVDDGIDQDGDGLTYDDDPTIITVSSWTPPDEFEENFSTDHKKEKAMEQSHGITWFETSVESVESNFEVADVYQYNTPNSFKTKLRASDSPQYWNYSLSPFYRDISYWDVRFACGNSSEPADLLLSFKNTGGSEIAKIKLEYNEVPEAPHSSNYSIKLYYRSPSGPWIQLSTTYAGGYLYNGWYHLRIEKNGTNAITYKLYHDINQSEQTMTARTDGTLGMPFSNLARVEWSSTRNPVVCPIFFWDEHRIGLISI